MNPNSLANLKPRQPGQNRKPRQPRKAATAAPNLETLEAASVLDVSGSAGDDSATLSARPGVTASGRQSRAKNATPRELADMLARLMGGGSVLLAMWLDVEAAALEPGEADAIAEPLARILSRQSWGKKVSRSLVNGDDYVALTFALASYGLRVAPLVREKLSNHAQPIPTPPPVRAAGPDRTSGGGVNVNASNGYAPVDIAGGVKFSGIAGFGADA